MEKREHHFWEGLRGVVGMLFVVQLLIGCGYHFKGTGLKAPEGVQSIAVLVLENKTSDIGLETLFTGDLVYEFTRSKILRVVGREAADAVLKGSILSVSTGTISHTETFASDERRVTVTLDLILTRADGKFIWADSGLSDSEVFRVTSDKTTAELNKRAAIEVISKRLAEKAHTRIFQDF